MLCFLYLQSQLLFHCVKIFIVVNQLQVILDAECRNKNVNCLSYRDASLPEGSIVLRCSQSNVSSDEIAIFQAVHDSFCFLIFSFVSKSPEKFCDDEVTGNDAVSCKFKIEQVRIWRRNTSEIVDPC